LQGEPGANALKGPTTLESAVADFKKKFQDKTKNKWEQRDNFKAHPGKYTLLEMGEEDEDDSQDTTVWRYFTFISIIIIIIINIISFSPHMC